MYYYIFYLLKLVAVTCPSAQSCKVLIIIIIITSSSRRKVKEDSDGGKEGDSIKPPTGKRNISSDRKDDFNGRGHSPGPIILSQPTERRIPVLSKAEPTI